MAMDFHGKYIWIIGASSGIGKALAHELASRGAIIALSARGEDALNTVKENLYNADKHISVPVDVSKTDGMSQARDQILEKFPRLDSAISLAAIYDPSAVKDMNIETAHKITNVNLGGMFNFVHAVLPTMRTQKFGQIVLCGSVAGYCGLPNGQPYSASKAAVINLAQSLRCEEGDMLDIKVINPGFVETPMTDKNDFDMPMKIKPEEAAKSIADGLLKKSFEIHFPKKFTFIMKAISLLPAPLYFMVAKRFKK